MPDASDERLESWKEIAAYLGREVRTVQLWEKNEGLPVHRHQHARQGSVYAFKAELDSWRNARKSSPPAPLPTLRTGQGIWFAAAILLTIAIGGGLTYWRNRSVQGRGLSSVAVLPFLDLSPRKDSEYFSDGLSEEIIDALSRVPNLRVVARTSSFAFKGKNDDIREIGRQLNVNAVIEGSVRKSGDSLRITAQLNRVTDGYHIWSHTYDRQLRDVFAVQREISESIASELRAGRPASPVKREPTRDTEAYRLYQEGRFFFNKFEAPESNLKAIERYRQATARDPNFAAAYAGMADAYSYLAENFVSAPREVMPRAKEAAEKALALDDSSAEAHTSLGIVKLDYERDIEGGQREFLRALQLNPGFGWARHWYAHSLEAQNRVEEALPEMRAALELDPLSIPINWDIASELVILKRYDQAFEVLNRAKELFPGVPTFDYIRVVGNWRRGNPDAARAVVESLRKQADLANDPEFLTLFATEEAREGHAAEARRLFNRIQQMQKTQYVEPVFLIEICKALGDREQLALLLRRVEEEHSSMAVYLRPYASLWGLEESDLGQFGKS
jgi:serine/threonine-protein kinase